MNRPLLALLVGLVSAIVPSVVSAELQPKFSDVLRSDTFQSDELAEVEEPELSNTLFVLAAEHQIKPLGSAFHQTGNKSVFIVPLDAGRPSGGDESLTLFFDRSSKSSFFLLLTAGSGSVAGGSVRLWGEGPTEIVIDAQGIYYSPVPSFGTFRLPAHGNGAEKSVADNILCLARLLGFTVNPTNLNTAISSIVCSVFAGSEVAHNLAELVLIGGHCFSAVNCLGLCPASSALCITGLAKWISCGIAECSGTSTVPSAPQLSSPADGAVVSGTAVTLSWAGVDRATKYQSQLNRDSSFSNPITSGEYPSTGARWTNFANDGSRWYWRARAGNDQGWSQWSSSRFFINGTVSAIPPAPSLLSPANGARVSGTSVTLTFNPASGATKYQTQLSRDSSFFDPINGGEYASTSVRWSNFANDGSRWYWRARAGNSQGWSQWSSSRSFINGP